LHDVGVYNFTIKRMCEVDGKFGFSDTGSSNDGDDGPLYDRMSEHFRERN
jgi:hypothetical protein